MDKKIAGVIGAITGLATLDGTAQAAPTPNPGDITGAQSFAELLEPIPNAVAMLRAADVAAARAETVAQSDANVQVAQYHHHHHRYRHHHHHHHRAIVIRPGRIIVRGHHHHHHHHHHRRYD